MKLPNLFSRKSKVGEDPVSMDTYYVDSYKYGDKSINIVKIGPHYYIENYEGMGIKMGPYADAIKTGHNGEIIVQDLGETFYYVPDPEREKPYGVGFIKAYHPEYHFAEPYTYPEGYGYAPVQMEDGKTRIKYSTGEISRKEYSFYYIDPEKHIEFYETANGEQFISAYDLKLPIRDRVVPNSMSPFYSVSSREEYDIVDSYSTYVRKQVALKDLPHKPFLSDDFIAVILEREKKAVISDIGEQSDAARENVRLAAIGSDLTAIDEIEIDMSELQERLDSIASVVIEKRRLAVREQEKIDQLYDQEIKAESKVMRGLDPSLIIKKADTKPRKKKGNPASTSGDPTLSDESQQSAE